MIPEICQHIVSHLRSDGELQVYIQREQTPCPMGQELLVRVEAAPINPADVKAMFCSLLSEQLETNGTGIEAVVQGKAPPELMAQLAKRIDVPLPIGNEGVGLVVSAGPEPKAQALLGTRVSVAAGGMFSDYRIVNSDDCIPIPDGIAPEKAASAWINPMSALAMIATMKQEGHKALVLTAAASSLGMILNRLCIEDGIPLVNVVRSEAQVHSLRSLGAVHICNSAAENFDEQLIDALSATGATMAFDATGGGRLAGRILRAMELALAQTSEDYHRYGSSEHKHLYFFGGLDPAPVMFERNFGMAWSMGGWLLQPVLMKLGPEAVCAMKKRVREGMGTIFFADYGQKISLPGILEHDCLTAYMKLATGTKYLVVN